MKITRRTALLGVAGSMLVGLPIVAPASPIRPVVSLFEGAIAHYSKNDIERQFWRMTGDATLKFMRDKASDLMPSDPALLFIRLSPRYHLSGDEFLEADTASCIAQEIAYDLDQYGPYRLASVDARLVIDPMTFEWEWRFFATGSNTL